MIFSCYELQTPIEITEGYVNTLVLENPVFYRNFVEDLLRQMNNADSRFAVFDRKGEINFTKKVELITDIFTVSFNDRFMQNKVNQIVAEEYSLLEEPPEDLLNQINQLGALLLSKLNFEATYSPITDMNGILKLLGFGFDCEELSITEKLMQYLDFLNQFSEKKLFIILNLKSLLTPKEFGEFVKLICYKKIGVLLIENHQCGYKEDTETIRIIDNVLCEF